MYQALNMKLRSIQNLNSKRFVYHVNINCISVMLSQDVTSYFSMATSFSLTTLPKYTSVHPSFGTGITGEFDTCLGKHYLPLAL